MTDQLFEGTRPTIVGLDLSLASTGIARIRPGRLAEVATLRPPHRDIHKRLEWQFEQITQRTKTATVVVIEGPSYGSTTGQQHERAGLWWIVAHYLWCVSTPYFVVTPSQVKKYAAGVGNASKDQVLAAVIRRYGDVAVADNNQADALVLAAMAADHYGTPIATVPQTHRAALKTVRNWPDLGARS